MGYYINAWLENGKPHLQIVDAKSKSVCVTWSYQGSDIDELRDTKEIQRLFRDLLLLTCKHEMKNCRVFQAKPPYQQFIQQAQDEFACT